MNGFVKWISCYLVYLPVNIVSFQFIHYNCTMLYISCSLDFNEKICKIIKHGIIYNIINYYINVLVLCNKYETFYCGSYIVVFMLQNVCHSGRNWFSWTIQFYWWSISYIWHAGSFKYWYWWVSAQFLLSIQSYDLFHIYQPVWAYFEKLISLCMSLTDKCYFMCSRKSQTWVD